MTLSELRSRSGSSQSQEQTPYGEEPRGTIRNAVSYQRPIDALWRGQQVRLIGQADVSGMSPCEKFVDEHGHIEWASSDEFIVNDQSVLPHSQEQRERVNNASRQTAGSRR